MARPSRLQRASNLFAVVALVVPSLAAASPASPSPATPGAPDLQPAAAGAEHHKTIAPQAGELLRSVLSSLGEQRQHEASPFEPPGRPPGRPPDPPGHNGPPNPPGQPSDRPPATPRHGLIR